MNGGLVVEMAVAERYEGTGDVAQPPRLTPSGRAMCVAALLPGFVLGTSEAPSTLASADTYFFDDGSWTGSDIGAPHSNAEMLHVIHQSTGASWSEIANLFGVSRRSIHYWAAGGALSNVHEQRLVELSQMLAASDLKGRDGFILLRDEVVRHHVFTERIDGLEARQGPEHPDQKVHHGAVERSISLT